MGSRHLMRGKKGCNMGHMDCNISRHNISRHMGRRISRALRGGVVCAAFALGGSMMMLPCAAAAQDTVNLSTEVVMSSSSLTSAQQSQVDRYVSHWMSQLLSPDNPAAMAQGRRRLTDPYSLPGVTDLFLAVYSPALSRALISNDALAHESPVVRTNAMIVASRLTDGGATALVQQGLRDRTPAVRYWAAVATANIASRLNADDQQSLLRALSTSWQAETSIDVLGRMLVAMDAINTPAAAAQLLNALNQRVDIHAGDAALPIRAEHDGLEGITVRTFTQLTSGRDVPSDQSLRQLVVVLFRYFDLSTGLLQKSPDAANAQDLGRIIQIAANYLPRITARLNPEASLGGLATRQANLNDLAATRLLVEEWRTALTTRGFGIDASQLVITPRPPATQPQ